MKLNPRHIDLNDEVLQTLIEMLGMHYFVKYLLLSRMWYCRISSFFNRFSAPMEEQFAEIYRDYLVLKKTKLVFSPTEFGKQRGIRIDRIMELQIKENSPDVSRNRGKTLKLEIVYRYLEEKSSSKRAR